MQVTESVGLVTGGASGLGEVVVRMLVGNGGRAVILDRVQSRGAEIAAELGQNAAFVPCDINDSEQVEKTFMCICPGVMDTSMLANATDELRQALADINVFPKRLGRPDDVAGMVKAFMENTYINGDVVRIDAGTRLAPR